MDARVKLLKAISEESVSDRLGLDDSMTFELACRLIQDGLIRGGIIRSTEGAEVYLPRITIKGRKQLEAHVTPLLLNYGGPPRNMAAKVGISLALIFIVFVTYLDWQVQ